MRITYPRTFFFILVGFMGILLYLVSGGLLLLAASLFCLASNVYNVIGRDRHA